MLTNYFNRYSARSLLVRSCAHLSTTPPTSLPLNWIRYNPNRCVIKHYLL